MQVKSENPKQTSPAALGLSAAGEDPTATRADRPLTQSAWEGTVARPKSRTKTPNPANERVRSPEAVFYSSGMENDDESNSASKGEGDPGGSHYTCMQCGRAFARKAGLGLHRRRAHFFEYNENIDVTRTKPRWTKEEEYLMARLEAELTNAGPVWNINERLTERLKGRSLDAIKSHRKSPRYRELVAKLRSQADCESTSCVADNPDNTIPMSGITPPPPQPNAYEIREAIKKELAALVVKQPPPEFDGPRLWEIVKRYLARDLSLEGLSNALSDFVLEVLHSERAVKRRPRPCPPKKPESHRKAKKRQCAETQERFKRRQGRCAREILDGEVTAVVEDPKALLEEWQTVMESTSTGTVSSVVERTGEVEEINRFGVIGPKEIRAALPSQGSAARPDGVSGKAIRKVPVATLRLLLNAMQLLGRLPAFLRTARTAFIPKKMGASRAADFRPITMSSVFVRLLHRVYAARLLAQVRLDWRQRAFIPVDGCAKNVVVLASAIEEAKRCLKPLCMASLDVAKAFDRVNLAAILRGLRRKGVSESFVDYIREFYTTSSTLLHYGDGSLQVNPTVVVRQGDPLSPLLFNLVVDEWLETCDRSITFEGETAKVNAMAFADDIVVLASTPRGLQEQL